MMERLQCCCRRQGAALRGPPSLSFLQSQTPHQHACSSLMCIACLPPSPCLPLPVCTQFGHDSRDCPNSLCWRCQRPGHMARDCPYGYRAQASWDEAGPAVCLRCGSETCPCAGKKDFVRWALHTGGRSVTGLGNTRCGRLPASCLHVLAEFAASRRPLQGCLCSCPGLPNCTFLPLTCRAEGGCKREYSERDLRHVRCYSCGRRGHLSCAAAPAEPAALSCHNCGQGGHTAAECSRELPQVIRGEMAGASHRGSFDRGGGGGYSSGGYGSGGGYRQVKWMSWVAGRRCTRCLHMLPPPCCVVVNPLVTLLCCCPSRTRRQQAGGYGSRQQPRYAAYSAYAEIEQPHRRRSYDDAFDRDGYGYGRQYNSGGDWGGGKRPRR